MFETCKDYGGCEKILETATHEMGHNVHENLIATRPELAERWNALHEKSLAQYQLDGRGFVFSTYATTNVFEDFAESYQHYIRDPERLRFMSPEKYAFMCDEVFAGREYQAQKLAYWDQDFKGDRVWVDFWGVYDLRGRRIGDKL